MLSEDSWYDLEEQKEADYRIRESERNAVPQLNFQIEAPPVR